MYFVKKATTFPAKTIFGSEDFKLSTKPANTAKNKVSFSNQMLLLIIEAKQIPLLISSSLFTTFCFSAFVGFFVSDVVVGSFLVKKKCMRWGRWNWMKWKPFYSFFRDLTSWICWVSNVFEVIRKVFFGRNDRCCNPNVLVFISVTPGTERRNNKRE